MLYDPTAFYVKDYVTIFALAFGPIAAVVITLWHQHRTEKRGAKLRLFVALMAHRKSIPIHLEWVNALNLIDVVFVDCPKVLERWHQMFQIIETKPWNQERFERAKLDFLSEMAKEVGYKKLAQTDIGKFYVPEAHAQVAVKQGEVQEEFLRVLKATEHMGPKARPAEKNKR